MMCRNPFIIFQLFVSVLLFDLHLNSVAVCVDILF